jgi:tetratricopeptide (TPR) repeat protein
VIAFIPDDAYAYFYLGFAQYKLEHFDDAYANLQEAATLDSSLPEVYQESVASDSSLPETYTELIETIEANLQADGE